MICCDRCRVKTEPASMPFVDIHELCEDCFEDVMKFVKAKQ